MKKIVIWGTSFKKIADEAQLLAHYKIIKAYCPEAEITYLTQPRNEIAQKYPEIQIVPFSKPFAALKAITTSQLLVIGGGPFFEEFLQFIKCLILVTFAKLLNIPLIVYGATIFPIQAWWAKAGYRFLLNHVNAILVRDHASYESLINIGVAPKAIQVGTDLRYALEIHESDGIKDILIREGVDINQPIISISTRYFDNHIPNWVKNSHGFDDAAAKHANESFAKVINSLSDQGQLVLIPMHPYMEEDLETAKAIQKEMDEPEKLIVLKNRYQVSEVLGIIKASEILITGRVGSILFASITGTPVLGIAYDKRTTELMHDLDLQEYVFNWKHLDYDRLKAASKKLLEERGKISALLNQKANEFRIKAKNDSMVYQYWLEKIK
jgi:polysaccharide pyruvyl transferase WcaK-like protein